MKLILSSLLILYLVAVSLAATPCLTKVNETRARRHLPPFILDPQLTKAAMGAADYRASVLREGHTKNDFAFVPAGSQATAAGCAAWPPDWGWGACYTYEHWKYAGAAYSFGRDGRRYMHLFVR